MFNAIIFDPSPLNISVRANPPSVLYNARVVLIINDCEASAADVDRDHESDYSLNYEAPTSIFTTRP